MFLYSPNLHLSGWNRKRFVLFVLNILMFPIIWLNINMNFQYRSLPWAKGVSHLMSICFGSPAIIVSIIKLNMKGLRQDLSSNRNFFINFVFYFDLNSAWLVKVSRMKTNFLLCRNLSESSNLTVSKVSAMFTKHRYRGFLDSAVRLRMKVALIVDLFFLNSVAAVLHRSYPVIPYRLS